jgi:3-oxoacyl-[acyl-carrier protein] reductase
MRTFRIWKILMEISGKVAVITGAASGIGRAVAVQLANRKVRALALVDLGETIDAVAAEVNSLAGREVAYAFRGNTTDEAFRTSVFDTMTKRFDTIRMCVPAAGITRDDLAVRIDRETGKARIYPVERFKQVIDVNLIAPVYWALEMIGRIAENRAANGLKRWLPSEGMQGAIVFIGSVSSTGNRGQISYASTKAGLEGAAATIMKEAVFHGVRCGLIHPGYTDTPMVRALGEDYINKNILPYTQLSRLIRPDEIGELWADAGWHAPA